MISIYPTKKQIKNFDKWLNSFPHLNLSPNLNSSNHKDAKKILNLYNLHKSPYNHSDYLNGAKPKEVVDAELTVYVFKNQRRQLDDLAPCGALKSSTYEA